MVEPAENPELGTLRASSGGFEEIVDKWVMLLTPLLKNGILSTAELCQFDRREAVFRTLWTSLREAGPIDDNIRGAHNTSLLEVLVHGDPISTTEQPLTSFWDWQDLSDQTGLNNFITIPALLFSVGDSKLVLIAGAEKPNWENLLAYLVLATKGNNQLPDAGSL